MQLNNPIISIGVPNKHKIQLRMFRKQKPERLADPEKGAQSATILGDVFIHSSATVHPSAVLGPNVSVGKGVTIGGGRLGTGDLCLQGPGPG